MTMLPNPLEHIRSRFLNSDDENDTEAADLPPGQVIGEVSARAVDPTDVHLTAEATRMGDRWATTIYLSEWPDYGRPAFLDEIINAPPTDATVDVSVHADPYSDRNVQEQVEGAIRNLQSVKIGKQQNNDPTLPATQRDLKYHNDVHEQLTEKNQKAFDVSLYLTIRADHEETVERVARRITHLLSRQQFTARPVPYRQLDGLTAGSPVAFDPFTTARGADRDAASTTMLGGALGTAYPFTANTIIEESGVLVGYHATSGSPVVVDRFNRDNGHNVFTAGKIGAGKSYGTKALNLRELARDPDTSLIMLDPLEGFRELSDGLNAEHIVLGGRRGVNPLEIRETPQEALDKTDDLNPYSDRFSSVMDFFEDFFATIDVELGERRSVLGAAINAAYYERGITTDPTTHGRDSPTIRDDVYPILGDISKDAKKFLLSDAAQHRPDLDEDDDVLEDVEVPEPTPGEVEKWEDRAEDLRIALRPFVSGQYANLGGESDINIRGEKAVYLDLQQGEASREMALMMQLLLDAVYERIKEESGKTILAIDEAHYLTQHGGSLEWLERLVRHSRHHDLSLHLVTQEASDFFVHEKAKTIADNCSQKIIHRLPGLSSEHADALGLSDRQARYVRDAAAGSAELGYSPALLDVGGGPTLPVRITALNEEERLIEGEVTHEGSGEASVAADGGTEQ